MADNVAEPLTSALTALRAGDDARGLRELLRAWKSSRDVAVADLIEALGSRLDSKRERPGGRTVPEKQSKWLALEGKRDLCDVGSLLATLAENKKAELLGGRIVRLAKRQPDPRIAMRLARMTEDWPVPGSTGVASLRLALSTIVAIADARTVAELERIGEHASHGHMTQWVLRNELPEIGRAHV